MESQIYDVGFSYKNYRSHVHNVMKNTIWPVSVLAIILLFVFPLFFRTGIVVPLKRLMEGIQRADQGNLEGTIPVEVEDEIGSLTRSFNHMIESIKESRQELASYTKNLEITVNKRTQDLSCALEELKKKDRRIQTELDIASEIQTGLLPKTPMLYNNINIVTYYKSLEKSGRRLF